MPEDPNTLFDEAKCFRCSSDASLSDLLKLALLQRIADGSAGGGSQFISGAGAPAAAPSNPDAPAQYFDTANDFTYNWNLGTQAWVPVPKVYRASFTQAGIADPTAVAFEDTIGVTWTRIAAGQYETNQSFPVGRIFIQDSGDWQGNANPYQLARDGSADVGYYVLNQTLTGPVYLEVSDAAGAVVDYSTIFGATTIFIQFHLYP